MNKFRRATHDVETGRTVLEASTELDEPLGFVKEMIP